MIILQSFILLISSLLLVPVNGSKATAEEVILEKASKVLQEQVDVQQTRFQLNARWIPGSLRELDGKNIVSVQHAGPLKKYSSFEVTYTQYGQMNQAEIQLQIQAEQKLPVLAERKLRGEKLSEEDFIRNWISVDLNRDKPIVNLNEISGKTLRKTLNAGQFITANDIGRAFLVEAGDEITMIYRENGLEINIGCDARQDGAANEEIQVYCKETRKKYLVRITGPGETEWLKTH